MILFLVALAPRVGFLVIVGPPEKSPDAIQYLTMADNLARRGVYEEITGRPSTDNHVLYVWFLAPFVACFGPDPVAALYAQCALAAVCAPLACWLGWRLVGALAGWLAGLFCATYMPLFVYPSQFLTETLTAFWLYLSFVLAELLFTTAAPWRRTLWSALLGGVFALMALTNMIAFPLVFVAVCAQMLHGWRRPRVATAGALLCVGAFAAVYSPWVIRNYLTLDRFVLLDARTKVGAMGPDSYVELIAQGHGLIEAREMAVKAVAARAAKGEGASAAGGCFRGPTRDRSGGGC